MKASRNICTDEKLQSRGHFQIALASIFQTEWITYVLVQAAITKYHRLDGFNNKDFSMVSEAGKSKIKVPADPVWWQPTSWLETDGNLPVHSPEIWGRETENNLFLLQFSCSVVSNSLWPHGLQHAKPPGLSLPEFTQTHVHQVGDAIQPSHPLSSPSPPAFNLSQNQRLFKWVSSSHQVAKVTLSLSYKDSDPIHEGSIFTSNNHPKAPPPNPITLKASISTHEFWGGPKHSVHNNI